MQGQISITNHLEDRNKHSNCAFKQVLEIDGVTLLISLDFPADLFSCPSVLLSNTVTLCSRWFECLHLT